MRPQRTTLNHHILETQKDFPYATGEFSDLLASIALTGKVLHREVNRAGLGELLGSTGGDNVQGEQVQKLDDYANDLMIQSLQRSQRVCVLASEEVADAIPMPDDSPSGKYAVAFDPLDGSSNIDANVSIGTIFAIFRRQEGEGRRWRGDPNRGDGPGTDADVLRPGREQVAAGYILYGSSSVFVYTAGNGVNGFTLDPGLGEFLLSHPDIRIPDRGKIYSVNEQNFHYWKDGTRNYIDWVKSVDSESGRPYSARYIGSLVADFHRNLLYGGVFLYPEDTKDPKKPTGKLRLLYEANPLAFVAEQAGGAASTGDTRILDIDPSDLHQRVPLIIGSRENVAEYEAFYQGRR